jgi:hypothetical protein
MWKLFGTFFPTLFGVSYSGVEAPAARTQRRAGDPPHPQVRQIPWKIGRNLSWKMTRCDLEIISRDRTHGMLNDPGILRRRRAFSDPLKACRYSAPLMRFLFAIFCAAPFRAFRQ